MSDRITKRIAYAFATSPDAKALGFVNQGCWHVSQTRHDIEGSGQACTFLPHDAEGFTKPDDPALIDLFTEYEGDICPSFRAYGHPDALAALGI